MISPCLLERHGFALAAVVLHATGTALATSFLATNADGLRCSVQSVRAVVQVRLGHYSYLTSIHSRA